MRDWGGLLRLQHLCYHVEPREHEYWRLGYHRIEIGTMLMAQTNTQACTYVMSVPTSRVGDMKLDLSVLCTQTF